MWQWETLKESDRVSTRRKKNYGVKKHRKQWLKDLVEVQGIIHDRKMRTDEYKHMTLKNGKKERDISKLNFHPNHIEHQSLVLVSHDRKRLRFKSKDGCESKGTDAYGTHRATFAIITPTSCTNCSEGTWSTYSRTRSSSTHTWSRSRGSPQMERAYRWA